MYTIGPINYDPPVIAWCHLGNFACLHAPVPGFRKKNPSRPCLSLFVLPFLSFFLSRLYLLVPLFVTYVLLSLLFADCFFFLLVRLIFLFVFCVLISFCFPGVLSGGVHMLVFCFCLCFTPLAMRANLKSSKKCAFSCVLS